MVLLGAAQLNANISSGPKQSVREAEKEGEQHAEYLGLMDALRGGICCMI
jgi:hypothetical protein